jgi:hypothetical protein
MLTYQWIRSTGRVHRLFRQQVKQPQHAHCHFRCLLVGKRRAELLLVDRFEFVEGLLADFDGGQHGCSAYGIR